MQNKLRETPPFSRYGKGHLSPCPHSSSVHPAHAHSIRQTTPCAPSSNMRALFYLLLQHAFSQALPSVKLACSGASIELALALLQASSCSAIRINLAQCCARGINMAQCCALSLNAVNKASIIMAKYRCILHA